MGEKAKRPRPSPLDNLYSTLPDRHLGGSINELCSLEVIASGALTGDDEICVVGFTFLNKSAGDGGLSSAMAKKYAGWSLQVRVLPPGSGSNDPRESAAMPLWPHLRA
jgi:hypothetical protein